MKPIGPVSSDLWCEMFYSEKNKKIATDYNPEYFWI